MTITSEMIERAYTAAVKRGKVTADTTQGDQAMAIVAECVEFYDAYRRGLDSQGDELADVCIALMTMAKIRKISELTVESEEDVMYDVEGLALILLRAIVDSDEWLYHDIIWPLHNVLKIADKLQIDLAACIADKMA